MADAPRLYPYIVAISFAEGGPLYLNAVLAYNEALASAAVTVEFFQKAGTDKPLMGVSVAQLVPEFLRMALRACEGTLSPDGRNVVALVPAEGLREEPALDSDKQLKADLDKIRQLDAIMSRNIWGRPDEPA